VVSKPTRGPGLPGGFPHLCSRTRGALAGYVNHENLHWTDINYKFSVCDKCMTIYSSANTLKVLLGARG
jgi:hypothetical protein